MEKSGMEAVLEMAKGISDAIVSSGPYKAYTERKSVLMANPELLTRIQIFKRIQMEYQSKVLQDIQPSFDEEKYMSKLYADLMLNEDARAFLEIEEEILGILRNVYETIGEHCEIETFM